MLPKITIVTPSYNQGEYLEETIQSVLNQNYPNLEYIIMDGGSTDNSVEIIKKYDAQIDFWVSESDSGQSDAINKGFVKSTGNILGWLNSDDLLKENSLINVGKYFSENPDCYFLTGDGEFISVNKEKVYFTKYGKDYNYHSLLKYHKGNFLPQPSVFFRKEIVEKVGLLDLNLNYTMDLDFWLRIIKKYKLYYINETLSSLRQHDKAKTLKDNYKAMKEVEIVIKEHSKNLNNIKKIYYSCALKKFVSYTLTKSAQKQYSLKNFIESKKQLKQALKEFPLIVFNCLYFKVLARLILPRKIKKIIFKSN